MSVCGTIKLITAISESETAETETLAEVYGVTQNEFAAAGKKDIKPSYKFVIWSFEYGGQTDITYMNQRFTVYRIHPRPDGKTELYVEERTGKR